jgi:CRISPR/Cas system endoribonuclease Cas6 (RAMP superfamily)
VDILEGKSMKISMEILLNGEKPIIPSDYRRSMLSLIKEAIKSSPGYKEIYDRYLSEESGKVEPFTFSVSFKAVEKQNDKGIIHLAEPWIKLYFSTNDPAFLKCVCNGLIKLPKDYLLFPELKAKVGPFYCQECTLLRCNGCKLKVTIGHVDLEPD